MTRAICPFLRLLDVALIHPTLEKIHHHGISTFVSTGLDVLDLKASLIERRTVLSIGVSIVVDETKITLQDPFPHDYGSLDE